MSQPTAFEYHVDKATDLAAYAHALAVDGDASPREAARAGNLLAEAQIHATLALAEATLQAGLLTAGR
jgi:hypothetical protein